MNDIQFVFEKPQKPVRAVKKRSRLITSCDACLNNFASSRVYSRLKKIKCRPTTHGDGKCGACEASGSACIFEERDRIRSQRGIANFTVAPTRHGRKARRSAPLAAGTSTTFIATEANESSQSPIPSSSTHLLHDEGRSIYEGSIPATHSAENRTAVTATEDYSFFDLRHHTYPHPRLLPHLVDIFFLYAGSIFPFFDSQETIQAAREGTLSPLIANCLAAYAARFSDEIRHASESRHSTGDAFLDAAKDHLSNDASNKLERLHGTILIAWAENGSGRTDNFYAYSQMASSLATDLKLDSEEYILLEPCETTRNRCRQTFWAVTWLEIIACSVRGKPCSLRLSKCSTGMPYPEISSCGPLSRTTVYSAFKGVLNLMVSLNNFSNAGKPSTPSIRRDIGLRHIQHAIMTFRDGLPPSLAFSKENVILATVLNESFAFYLVHILMHCFLVIVHCPSLFWASQPPETITEVPRLDIAWSAAMAIVDMLNLMRRTNILFPFGLSSTFLPLSIARGALMMAQSNKEGAINGSMTVEEFESRNNYYLDQNAEMLQILSRYWANMLQVEISAEPVPLYGVQTVPRNSNYETSIPRTLSSNHWKPPTVLVVPSEILNAQEEPVENRLQHDGRWQHFPVTRREITFTNMQSLNA